MMHVSREQILEIGNAIEVAGNITLAAAAIFGVLSIFIVLATVDNEKSIDFLPALKRRGFLLSC